MFGLGLIEAIRDSVILANADPTDANGDTVAGVANIDNGVIGRFGWKSAVPTVHNFVGLALVNELGLTNPSMPNEMSPQGQPAPAECVPRYAGRGFSPGASAPHANPRQIVDLETIPRLDSSSPL